MKRSLDGGITVFLSLILTCICALAGGLFESARLAGCGWYMQMAINSSLDSLMSSYHREAWEQYRLFLLEYDSETQLAGEMEPYCSSYLEEASFYPLENRTLSVSVPARITDLGGVYFEQEAVDYMKFGVWDLERDLSVLPSFSDGLQEAESFQNITDRYQQNGRKVLGLERSLDRIGDCLKKQSEHLEKGKKALKNCNGYGFRQAAEALKKELNRIPDLTAAYEKEAERLRQELEESEAEAAALREDLKAGTWSLAVEEMEQYRSYIDVEGSRRKEVLGVGKQAEANQVVVEKAIQKAEEVQEYIDSWEEEEDEEDELDEEELWEQVLDVLEDFQTDSRFQNSGIQDKGKMNILEAISRMAGTDLLEICVPEGRQVSGGLLDQTELPSRELSGGGAAVQGSLPDELLNRALMSEYGARFFASFLRQENSSSRRTGIQYEQEYILHGEASDRENLKAVVNRLIAVREAANLLVLLSDAKLRSEAELLALSITGAAALSPLTGVVAFFIMAVWAFAESVEEVRLLLAGEKIAFVKNASQWKVSLTKLAEAGTAVWQGGTSEGDSETGLDYQGWLKLFFLIQGKTNLRFRMMDMIQTNLRREQPDFRMKRCAFRVAAELSGEGPLVSIRRTAVQEY